MSFQLTAEAYKQNQNHRRIVRQTANLTPVIQRYADLTIPVQREFRIDGLYFNLIGSILFVGNNDIADFNSISEDLRQKFESQIETAVRNEMNLLVQDSEWRDCRWGLLRAVVST